MESGIAVNVGHRSPVIATTTNRLSIKPAVRKSRKTPKYTGPLWWWSGFEKYDGYGDIARNATLAAAKIGNIRLQAFQHYHKQLQSELGLGSILSHLERKAEGPQFSIQSVCDVLPPMGTKNALFTMHESSILDPSWVEAINKYDLVIVPCDENAQVFRRHVRPPVEVVNIGLDQSLYRSSAKTAGTTFRFGTAGNIRHVRERKGMDRVIEWFLAAFPRNNNVSLSVKLNAPAERILSPRLKLDPRDDQIFEDDSRIEIIRENMPHRVAAEWLRSIDCYVDASAYEGWGMWPFHAMATGRPVIGTYFGGHREYFEFGNHIPIGYRIERAQSHYQNYGEWAMPIAAEGIEAMQWAYRNPRETRKIGLKASKTVKRFTWQQFAKGVFQALAKHGIYQT